MLNIGIGGHHEGAVFGHSIDRRCALGTRACTSRFLLHAHIWAYNFHIALNFVSRCTGGGKSRDRFVKYDKYRAFPTIVRQAFSCDVNQYARFRSRLLSRKRKENSHFSLEIYVI